MYNIIERYMSMLKKEDINNFATKKNVFLSESELNFTYEFLKKNWQDILKNPNVFDINRYKNQFSEENFYKVKKIFDEYYQKFKSFI